jgi:hypothetical protein
VNLEDPPTTDPIRCLHRHPTVEAPGAQKRRIEDRRSVGRGQHDDRLDALEPVHLSEDLIKRLLTLIVAPRDRDRSLPRSADRIQVIDEDD